MKIECKLMSGLLLSLLSVFSVQGKVALPALLSDNMVLQQQSNVKLWGTAKADAIVTIIPDWGGNYTAKVAADGQWEAKISTPKAGGPYSIKFSDGEVTTLNNILIGEVWVCSGQSNMAMRLKGFKNQMVNKAQELIADADPKIPIRSFTVPTKMEGVPQSDCGGSWKENTSDNLANTSAVGYFFAKSLYEKLQVPVGIIIVTWSGTQIEPWMTPDEVLAVKKDTDLSHLTKDIDYSQLPKTEVKYFMRKYSVMYNAMIAPLQKNLIKGVIWYQGESNRRSPEWYETALPALVQGWRRTWQQGEFPFYYVQIAPYDCVPHNPANISGASFREAQLRCLAKIPNSGMVVTLDIGEKNNIHPAEKEKVGQRLANWALAKTYGVKGINVVGPLYKSFEVSGSKIILHFETSSSLRIIDMEPGVFEIAGKDKGFNFAKAEVSKNGKDIIVFSDSVAQPIAVRYGYRNYVKGCLFDSEGLPAPSFRTDNW